ncbi:MAG: sigma-70 family RNA polymerase sigma factor [Chloroflexi bacterium]|nr:sigma-70 family RNA polymerase sigma factor [Chloroflexota bacterium]
MTEPIDRAAAARSSLATLVEAESGLLLAVARTLIGPGLEAEDVVQETLERALRNLDQLRDPKALRAWLLRIEVREAFRLRRRFRRRMSFQGTLREIAVGDEPHAERVAVHGALARLTPRVRTAVALHHLAGLPVSDVALAMGVSPNTVKSQLKIGTAQLRELLRDG